MTAAQLAPNRQNAKRSTSLHAQSHIIRREDPEALAQLTAEYYAEFHPATPRERDLVDTIIHNQWLIRRLRLTEADLYALHFQRRDDDFEEKWRFKVLQREHPLADSFESLEKRLLRLQSRLNALERSTRTALKELSGAGASACQPAEGRQPIEEPAPSSEFGFVPSNLPPAAPPKPYIGFVPPVRSPLSVAGPPRSSGYRSQ
jgi:hypothetical protein